MRGSLGSSLSCTRPKGCHRVRSLAPLAALRHRGRGRGIVLARAPTRSLQHLPRLSHLTPAEACRPSRYLTAPLGNPLVPRLDPRCQTFSAGRCRFSPNALFSRQIKMLPLAPTPHTPQIGAVVKPPKGRFFRVSICAETPRKQGISARCGPNPLITHRISGVGLVVPLVGD